MFIGYTNEHPGNVYKMLNLQTHKVLMCRDIQQLNKTYAEYRNLSRNQVTKILELEVPDHLDDDYDTALELVEPDPNEDITLDHTQEQEGNINDMRLERKLRKLDTSYNPTMIFNANHQSEGITTHSRMVALIFEHIEFGLITPEMVFNGAEDDTAPKTFHEAWDHNDPDKRAIWRSAIKDEFTKMNKKKVWRHRKKQDIL